ncbi:MAG: biotin--[Tidjanibacter sp.]|nr:biotin--[acetyl-CoA-carboxylase] ligase [Tidjanibacter sp.]
YVGDKKICGVLIENRLSGAGVARSVVGIGLNIGQREFPEWIPNPTSIVLEGGGEHTPKEVLELLHAKLMARYDSMAAGDGVAIEREYNDLLYRRGEEHTYTLPDGTPLQATLLRVERDGRLMLRTTDGKEHGYHFGEIFFRI